MKVGAMTKSTELRHPLSVGLWTKNCCFLPFAVCSSCRTWIPDEALEPLCILNIRRHQVSYLVPFKLQPHPLLSLLMSVSFLILIIVQPFSPFLVHTAHSWMFTRLHHLCYLYTPSFFPATMLWVTKHFTFSSPGIIWKIFFVSLYYGNHSVLSKLETKMEKHTLVNTNSKFLQVWCVLKVEEKKIQMYFWTYLSLI